MKRLSETHFSRLVCFIDDKKPVINNFKKATDFEFVINDKECISFTIWKTFFRQKRIKFVTLHIDDELYDACLSKSQSEHIVEILEKHLKTDHNIVENYLENL